MDEVKFCKFCNRPVEMTNVGWVCDHCQYILDDDEVLDEPEGEIEGLDDIPECCRACGGPYPSCQTSCSIFDD